jgi:hypothetical protein
MFILLFLPRLPVRRLPFGGLLLHTYPPPTFGNAFEQEVDG